MFESLIPYPYLLLVALYMAGSVEFCLHKVGHGRLEDKDGFYWNLLAIGTIPIIVIAGVGGTVATVWAMFELSFWKVVTTVFLVQVLWGGLCWFTLGHARAFDWEHIVYAVGIPTILLARAVAAVSATLLLIGLWNGYT